MKIIPCNRTAPSILLIAGFIAATALLDCAAQPANHIISWKAPATNTNRMVAPGDTVTWIWDDALPHTVTSTTSLFDSGTLTGLGVVYRRVFPSLGEFGYLCAIHGAQSMSGTITVAEPLPVELTGFSALVDGSDVVLNWSTASETNNAGFFVQLGGSTLDWVDLAFVDGAGHSTRFREYRHTITGLSAGLHRFRLKQIDFDGSTTFSEVLEVDVEVPGTHVVSAAYPNPLTGDSQFQASVRLSVAVLQQVEVLVFAADGRLVDEIHRGTLDAGATREITIDASTWPSGSYFVRFRGERFDDTRLVTVLR